MEIQVDGVWGAICDEEWTSADADVVCYQLGYSGAMSNEPAYEGEFGQGDGYVVQQNIICQVSYAFINGCSPQGCTQTVDLTVFLI